MADWINRTVGVAARNGTSSHTITFTPATSGRLLMVVMSGSVTHTMSTSGYTKRVTAVNSTELAVWTKTAAASESSLTVTHNASNYPVEYAIYEFPAGSAWLAGSNQPNTSTWAALTGLTGTPTVFAAISQNQSAAIGATVLTTTTSAPWTEDYDDGTVYATTEGANLSIGYQSAYASSSVTPSQTVAAGPNSERAVWAITVASSGTTPVTSDLDLRWRVNGRVSSDLDARWAVRSVVTSDSDLRWRVLNKVNSDLDLRWPVRNIASSDIDLRWRVNGRVSSDLDARWAVRSAVTSDSDLRWRVFGRVSSDADLRWAVRAAVSSDLDLRWAVQQSAGTVTSLLDLRWGVGGRVTSDLDLRWPVRALVSSDLDARWGVRSGLSSNLDLRWRVLQVVESDLDARWIVRNRAFTDLDLRWSVAGRAVSTLDLRWRVLADGHDVAVLAGLDERDRIVTLLTERTRIITTLGEHDG